MSCDVFPPLLVLLTCPFLLLPILCSPMKEYVTVGQLNHIYGMPKVESSPTSPLRQPLQPGAVDPAFSRHGSSLSLSVEVCLLLPSFPSSSCRFVYFYLSSRP